MSDAIIVIPARDEAAAIFEVVSHAVALGYPVIVVDDASTDGTGTLARAAGADVIPLPGWMGNMRAVQAGLRRALATQAKYIVTLDADGQHNPADIPALLLAAGQGHCLVMASYPERVSTLRRIAWWWFRLLSGLTLADLTTGFKVYGREAAALLVREDSRTIPYQDVAALLFLRTKGIVPFEMPVVMYPRLSGASHVFANWGLVFRYMVRTTVLCLRNRVCLWP